jgi:hypothetical protein
MGRSQTAIAASWRRAFGLGLAICLTLAVPAFAQAPQEGTKPPSGSPTPRRGDTGGPMQLVVDTVAKRTFTDPDFKRLAEAKTGPTWKNRDNEEVLTVHLWALLKEGGVSREAIRSVRIHSRTKLLVSLERSELAKMDQLVLRTGDQPNRPWRLSSLDPKDPNPYGRAVIRRIEVTTTAAAK